MRKPLAMTAAIGVILIGSAALAGCGANQHIISAPENIQHSLPASFQAKLSAPQSRLKRMSTLPVTTADIISSTQNVLYIAPAEQYAIAQFMAVWDKLSSKPAVVWTGAAETSAKAIWAKEGYKGNPLSTTHTFFVMQSLATPDAYHRKGKVWQEEPGITPNKDISFWVKFFGN